MKANNKGIEEFFSNIDKQIDALYKSIESLIERSNKAKEVLEKIKTLESELVDLITSVPECALARVEKVHKDCDDKQDDEEWYTIYRQSSSGLQRSEREINSNEHD